MEIELAAIVATASTGFGSILTYVATRKRTKIDDEGAFRRDLLERVRHLEDRDASHEERCDKKIATEMEKAKEECRNECRQETSAKLRRLAAKLTRDHEGKIAQAVEEVASEAVDEAAE